MGKDLKGKELGKGISQRKDKRYQARFTNRYGERECFCDQELYKVREWLGETQARDTLDMNAVNKTTTLNQWFEKWMDIYKYGVIAPSTEKQYRFVYKKHIKPVLGNNKLYKTTHLQVKSLINDLDRAGYRYETKNKVRIILLDMFNKAMIDNLVTKNPARGVRIQRDEVKEPRYLEPEEQQAFFEYSRGTFYDNLFVVAVNTGLRPGELYALTEKDLDFKKKEISVTKTLLYQKFEGDEQKMFHLGQPKTKSSVRKVPMTRACEAALKKQILQSRIIKGRTPKALQESFKDLLFTTKFGTPINAQIECDAIKAIVDGINLVRDDIDKIEMFSGHCFRHTFASNCFHNDIPLKTVQLWLGHATMDMTANLYTHIFKEKKKDNIDVLSDAMDRMEKQDDAENVEEIYHLLKRKEAEGKKTG